VGNPVPTGKWVLVVSVISVPQRKHVIYVNGQAVMESELGSGEVLIRPGQCRLGNWLSEGYPGTSASRGLRGLVDEVSVWNRTLSASKVAALTESGRPSLLWSRENPPLKVPMPKP
ncbi:MAG: LamG-like jellyroll fold domain-containing protein, partial [Verrucomicrobiota bacterium]